MKAECVSRWLNTTYLMLDANFRLKLKERNLNDPALGDGLAYFVEERPYLAHVEAAGEQTEVGQFA